MLFLNSSRCKNKKTKDLSVLVLLIDVNSELLCPVYRQANNINMLKDGMRIEATHVRKKQLHQYLPPEVVQRKKRV